LGHVAELPIPIDAEPLVLLPGMNCSAQLWSYLQLGRVLTPRLAEPAVDQQVDKLLDELPERFALAGLSLGGVLAMALTRRAPERVTRLALMSTNPYPPTAIQMQRWARQRAELAAGATARDLQQSMLTDLLSPETLTTRPEVVALTLAMADEVGNEALDAQLQLQASRVDERPSLVRVQCPTLILAGVHDALCSVERHEEMATLIPGAELVIVNCAHLTPLELPAQVAIHLVRWRSLQGAAKRLRRAGS
jgi:pimeloyl-ACP methyl ester carboxylesterase